MGNSNYVQTRIDNNYNFDDDEYLITENRTHELADIIAKYISEKEYKAFLRSDENLITEGKFDAEQKESLLPNKTLVLIGGLGWIGKNNHKNIIMSSNEILIFRTSITKRKDIERIEILFAEYPQIHKWSVDFEDWEKVLRIESEGITISTIIDVLQAVGVTASELE